MTDKFNAILFVLTNFPFFAHFSRGFDLVDHHSLLAELRALDGHLVIIKWICAFLFNRPQRLKIGSSVSPPVYPNGGIPQGTKLAAMLFATLVNRLVAQWPTRVKYVDYTTVFEVHPRCSTSYLQLMTLGPLRSVRACGFTLKNVGS